MPDEIKESITNKVLEIKIDGLTKLTDERFGVVKETLTRMENASYVTIAAFTKKIDSQDEKIATLVIDNTKMKVSMENSISTIKIAGSILVVVIGIAQFFINHYWR